MKTYLHLLVIAIVGVVAYSNTFQVPFVLDDIYQVENNQMIKDLDNFLLALKGHDFNGSGGYKYIPSRFVGYLSFALDYHFQGSDVTGYHITNLLIHIANALLVYFLVNLTFKTPVFRISHKMSAISNQQSEVSSQQSAVSSDDATTRQFDFSRFIRHGPHTGGFAEENGPACGGRFTIHDPRSFVDSRLIALFSALLFVSHPIQTQAVTYIVQRFASLAALFYLLSLVMYIKGRLLSQSAISNQQSAVRSEKSVVSSKEEEAGNDVSGVDSSSLRSASSVIFYLLSLLCAVLAMKTKEIAFTLPLVIILYESFFFTAPLKKKLFFLLPIALTLIIVPLSVMRSDKPFEELLSELSDHARVETDIPRLDYLLTEMRVITTYIRLIFLPINQNLDYDYPTYHSPLEPPVFLSMLFLLAVFGAAVWLFYRSRQGAISDQQSAVKSDDSTAQRLNDSTIHDSRGSNYSRFTLYRLAAFGILWFFITLSVESSIIPIDDVIFEHRIYLPSIGLLTAITAGFFTVANILKKEKITAALLVLITLAFLAATFSRNTVWKDSETLWEDVVKKSPNWSRPHNNLGTVYFSQGRLDNAMREFQTAIKLNINDADAHNNLGAVYERGGNLDNAMGEYYAAVCLKPDNAVMHNNLGKVYDLQGRPYDAMREFQAAVRINPDYADAHNSLEVLRKRMGNK